MFKSLNKMLLSFYTPPKLVESPSVHLQSYIAMVLPIAKDHFLRQLELALSEKFLTDTNNLDQLTNISSTLAKRIKEQRSQGRGEREVKYLTALNISIGISTNLIDALQFCTERSKRTYMLFSSLLSQEEVCKLIKSSQFHLSFYEVIDYHSLLLAQNTQWDEQNEDFLEGRLPDPASYVHYHNPHFNEKLNSASESSADLIVETEEKNILSI